MISIIDKPYYQAVSIIMAIIAMVIMAIVLITMLGLPKYGNKKLRRNMAICLVLGILTCIVDIISFLLFKKPEYLLAFNIVCEIDTVLLFAFACYSTGIIMRYIVSKQNKVKKILPETIRILYFICIIEVAIPPLFKKLYNFSEEGFMYSGSWLWILSIPLLLAGLLTVVYSLMNYKILGLKNTVLAIMLKLTPVLVFVIFDECEPAIILTNALVLLLGYIMVYQEMFFKLIEKEEKLSDMRTKVMLSQIQPHFLYNTLTTMAYLCRVDNKKAEELTLRFSDYLRNNINLLSDDAPIPFSKEIDNVKNYIEIEKCRFEDRIDVIFDIQNEDFSIPVLTVQPIVENAVKHGICKKKNGGKIKISSYDEADFHVVVVEDDGVGFDKNEEKNDGRVHVGLKNVEERIAKNGGSMEVESEIGKGTKVTIKIPFGG